MVGVVEGLVPKERRLPPQECLRVWVGGVVDEGDGREIILREKKKRVWLRLCFKFVVFVCLVLFNS